jgi:uncharacterized ion transporter superfamily protein YfcC
MPTPDRAPRLAPRSPDTLLILLALAAFAALLVPFLPAGYYLADGPVALDRFVVADHAVPVRLFADEAGEVGLLNVPFEGFTSGSRTGSAIGVIAFVLLVGGAFGVVRATGAIDRGINRLIAATGDRPPLLLALLFATFSAGGAVFGMGEETIAFLALLLPLLDRYGYPREVAVMITYMASQVGFATSWMNPFSVAVAQGIADVPLLSGAPLRIVMWIAFTALGVLFVLRYAAARRQRGDDAVVVPDDQFGLLWPDRLVLLAVLATVAWIIWGVVVAGYYIPEIATQFVTLGIVAGAIAVLAGRITANEAAAAFTDGVRQLVPTALVIALAKGILLLLGGSDPHAPSVLNTLLQTLGGALQGWPELAAAQGMLFVQGIFNLFVTSGSAQAAITMPLMAGLSDLLGVTRQVAVLAFQLGDGFTNLVTPASATMMGAIGVAGVPWTAWIRAIWRFELMLLAGGMLAIAIAVLIGFS